MPIEIPARATEEILAQLRRNVQVYTDSTQVTLNNIPRNEEVADFVTNVNFERRLHRGAKLEITFDLPNNLLSQKMSSLTYRAYQPEMKTTQTDDWGREWIMDWGQLILKISLNDNFIINQTILGKGLSTQTATIMPNILKVGTNELIFEANGDSEYNSITIYNFCLHYHKENKN